MDLDEFEKGSFVIQQWFMPLWSLTELLDYRDHFYPDVSDYVVETLFDHWDGLIRYVIIKPVEYMSYKLNDDEIVAKVDKIFDEAISRSDINATLVEYISERASVSDNLAVSDKIILLDVDDSKFQNQGTLLTRHAQRQVIARLDDNYKVKLLSSLGRALQNSDE